MPVYNAYPNSIDINYSGTIMKNPYCEYQIENTYKNLIENVDYISINHKTYTHIVGLNNYYGSCDIQNNIFIICRILIYLFKKFI